METLSIKATRRLALAAAGLVKSPACALPMRATGQGKRARDACFRVVERFGYLQLDTIAVTGARTQAIVLGSRIDGFDASLGEALLQPGQPYFEYWGHEACWLPMSLYPYFEFRRREYRVHPWWGDILSENRAMARTLLDRLSAEGPLRSSDLEEEPGKARKPAAMWETKLSKRIAEALWSCGELAIRERRNFQRIYDLPERVIPAGLRENPASEADSLDTLLLRALEAHGWATTGTLSATWRLRNRRPAILASLERLTEAGEIVPCLLAGRRKQGATAGWIRPAHLELAWQLDAARLHATRSVLLSPFDPVLWDRARVDQLFNFEQTLEIYKPQSQREYGYYCLPVLSGEWLIGRVDLKADRPAGTLQVRRWHRESGIPRRSEAAIDDAMEAALARFAAMVGLNVTAERPPPG